MPIVICSLIFPAGKGGRQVAGKSSVNRGTGLLGLQTAYIVRLTFQNYKSLPLNRVQW